MLGVRLMQPFVPNRYTVMSFLIVFKKKMDIIVPSHPTMPVNSIQSPKVLDLQDACPRTTGLMKVIWCHSLRFPARRIITDHLKASPRLDFGTLQLLRVCCCCLDFLWIDLSMAWLSVGSMPSYVSSPVMLLVGPNLRTSLIMGRRGIKRFKWS